MRYLLLLLLLPLAVLTTACSDASQVENAFISFLENYEANPLGADDFFDEDTKAYVSELTAAVRERDEGRAHLLGRKHEAPILTLIGYNALVNTFSGPLTEEARAEVTEESIWTALKLMGMGVFRHRPDLPIKIHESPTVYGDAAQLFISVPTGHNARLGSSYKYFREDDVWKLNYPSTLRAVEQVHAQVLRRNGGGLFDYARAQSNSVEPVNFEARIPY